MEERQRLETGFFKLLIMRAKSLFNSFISGDPPRMISSVRCGVVEKKGSCGAAGDASPRLQGAGGESLERSDCAKGQVFVQQEKKPTKI